MQISSTASSVQADTHFRAVCRALVAETLEFSDFLAKVTSGKQLLNHRLCLVPLLWPLDVRACVYYVGASSIILPAFASHFSCCFFVAAFSCWPFLLDDGFY